MIELRHLHLTRHWVTYNNNNLLPLFKFNFTERKMPVKTENNASTPEEEMTSSLEMEMTSLTIQLLSLTQNLVTAKLRMEATAKVYELI